MLTCSNIFTQLYFPQNQTLNMGSINSVCVRGSIYLRKEIRIGKDLQTKQRYTGAVKPDSQVVNKVCPPLVSVSQFISRKYRTFVVTVPENVGPKMPIAERKMDLRCINSLADCLCKYITMIGGNYIIRFCCSSLTLLQFYHSYRDVSCSCGGNFILYLPILWLTMIVELWHLLRDWTCLVNFCYITNCIYINSSETEHRKDVLGMVHSSKCYIWTILEVDNDNHATPSIF